MSPLSPFYNSPHFSIPTVIGIESYVIPYFSGIVSSRKRPTDSGHSISIQKRSEETSFPHRRQMNRVSSPRETTNAINNTTHTNIV